MRSPSRRPSAVRRSALATAFLLAVFLTPGGGAASASSVSQTSHQLNSAKGKLQSLVGKIQAERNAIAALDDQLKALDSKIVAGSANLQTLTTKLEQTRAELAQAEQTFSTYESQLHGMIAGAYMQGPAMQLQVLLSAQSFADLNDRMAYLDSISLQIQSMADRVAHDAEVLRTAGQQIKSLREKQQTALVSLNSQRKQVQTKTAQERAAVSHLGKLRNQTLTLIVKLKKQLKAEQLAALGNAFQGGNSIPFGTWAQGFLAVAGDPTCHDNLVVLVAWQLNEFTTAAYNPLATTYYMPGSTDFNSFGVKNYVSAQQGMQATLLTLQSGATTYGYGQVLDGLSNCWPAMKTAEAINASYWCHGCTLGQYVTGLIPKVEADYALYAGL
jgi:peptidoglycan hydrolase CwlO-like protein